MTEDKKLKISLAVLRITTFVVMAMWSLDKIVAPDHAGAIFANFYGLDAMAASLLIGIGVVQLLVEGAFVLGLWRLWTYGYVVVAHGISTLSSWEQYLSPFDNLLFFAALPMLGAAVTLFLLRDHDRMLTLGRR
ncbi:MAG: hypothetical protein WD382_04335 [Halofilum sp. (in: g-proteobacteria)]